MPFEVYIKTENCVKFTWQCLLGYGHGHQKILDQLHRLAAILLEMIVLLVLQYVMHYFPCPADIKTVNICV